MKMIRSLFAIILTLTIAFNGFTRPAYAYTDVYPEATYSSPFLDGFLGGLGTFLGGAAGTVLACYTVDVLIAPVAPPAAAYLAGLCPAIGAGVGGVGGGLVGVKLAKAP